MSSVVLSMTGFGRALHQAGELAIEVEIRSVNHRFLDLNLKLPRVYSGYEPDLRRFLSSEAKRGRIEVFVTRRSTDVGGLAVTYNGALFEKLKQVYADALRVPSATLSADITQAILSRREVLDVAETGSGVGQEYPELRKAVELALKEFRSMRATEGEFLRADLNQRLQKIEELRVKLLASSIKSPEIFNQRVLERVRRLSSEVTIDPSRLAIEVALLTERIDTTEELVRLESHLSQFRQSLAQGGELGRRLDFLVQEIGRELNTITSKAQDSVVQHLVIDAKTEVEKIKEQIQNVE